MKLLQHAVALAVEGQASDIHIAAGTQPRIKVHGELKLVSLPGNEITTQVDMQSIIDEVRSYIDSGDPGTVDFKALDIDLHTSGEVDLRVPVPLENERTVTLRMSLFKQMGLRALVARILPSEIPNYLDLKLPNVIRKLLMETKGLVLVTGPTGSGKSTTLASLIDYFNQQLSKTIITLEDPIEFRHTSRNCVVYQRELNRDTGSFSEGLRAALRQDPDIIMIGELRDLDTIRLALRAAETGHLVLATLHANSAHQSVSRLIEVFPDQEQAQIRTMLAASLNTVISQALLPREGGGRIGVYEVMKGNPAVSNSIRQSTLHQLPSMIELGKEDGMQLMKTSIEERLKANLISKEVARQTTTALRY